MTLIMPTLSYCYTETQMETINLYLQLPLQRKRILRKRQTCFFFICLNPPAAESRQPPGALSPLLFFFVTIFTHISVEVYYSWAVYTNKPTALFSLSCAPFFTVSVFMLRSKEHSLLLVHFKCVRVRIDQCRKEIEEDVLQILYHSQEMTHLNWVYPLFLVWYESLSFS